MKPNKQEARVQAYLYNDMTLSEREAFESQRRQLIEERRQEILEKANSLGYRVKQTEENGQIRMVLVRTA